MQSVVDLPLALRCSLFRQPLLCGRHCVQCRSAQRILCQEHVLLGNVLERFRLGELIHHMLRDPGKHQLAAVGLQPLRITLQHLDEGVADLGTPTQSQNGYCPLRIPHLWQAVLQGVRTGKEETAPHVQDGDGIVAQLGRRRPFVK